MDDLIVIILTLIIILAGVIGQLKKRPAENNNGNNDQFFNEDDLWSLPGENKDVKIQPGAITTEKQQNHQKHDHIEPHFKNKVAPGYSNDLTNNGVIKKYEKQEKKSKFPLRKAIIYSEIINRKYL